MVATARLAASSTTESPAVMVFPYPQCSISYQRTDGDVTRCLREQPVGRDELSWIARCNIPVGASCSAEYASVLRPLAIDSLLTCVVRGSGP